MRLSRKWKIRGIILVGVGVCFLEVPPAMGQNNTQIEDVLKGFEDDNTSDTSESEEEALEGFDEDEARKPERETTRATEPSLIQVDGYAKIGSSYNFAHEAPKTGETDWRGLSRLRAELQLDISLKFSDKWKGSASVKGSYDLAYGINGRDEFSTPVLDAYEEEWELRETYIQGSIFDNLDLKIGRQIVVWGKSDNIRITDVLNPLDLREPGLTDIEDLRLPVAMTRLDYYLGDWSITGIAVHEIRFNKMPALGHDFFPGANPLPFDQIPANRGENTEYALALNGIFSGWDIAFYAADVFDDLAHTEIVITDSQTQAELQHARLKMLGSAYNVAFGNWLLKLEGAYLEGFEFFNAPGQKFSRIDLGAGIEYSGFRDTTLSIESVNRRILDYEAVLRSFPDQTEEDEIQSVVMLSRDFFNQTLTLTYLLSLFGATGQEGLIQRFTVAYAFTDAIKAVGGAVFYESGDLGFHRNIGENDRLYLEIKYSF